MTIRRCLLLATLLAGLLLAVVPPSIAREDVPPVDVVELDGPLDRRLTRFALEAIRESEAQLVVLQIDVPGAVDEDAGALIDLLEDPPLPVAIWVGPDPARARGAALQLLAAAPIRGAAPGVRVGYAVPAVAGTPADAAAVADRFPGLPEEVFDGEIEISGPVPGLVDVVAPSIGQYVVGLDGTELDAGGRTWTLATARVEVEDGLEVIKPAAEVRFVKPGLIDRTLRLGVRAEVAFFFLVAGLVFAAFEFYAVGPGVAAAVALAALLIAGYGIAVLPVNWWAVAATLAGMAFYISDLQRNDLGWRSLLGTGLLLYGGLRFVELGPQITVSWWIIVLVVAAAGLFFGVAMTTVVRSRFATATIGRDHLVGRIGTAASDLSPDGVVALENARWRARASRAAGIREGDRVRVSGVDGIVLAVEPAQSDEGSPR